MEKKTLFAGTFDPYTLGHHSITERALTLFDKVIIAIGHNPDKQTMSTIEERMKSIADIYRNEPRVEVTAYEGLTTDHAKACGAQSLLRGVRSVRDFEYERDLADINREISGLETVILISEPQYAAISSSAIRELMRHGKETARFLPQPEQEQED